MREFEDITLPPFEMALREGGARSVMAAYTETDGVPASADPRLLTELLREEWGFTGTVVADYVGIGFLQTLHRVAADEAAAAQLAPAAGVDVELPTPKCYGAPLVTAVHQGRIPHALVDRAARRVLTQKCELGLLDARPRGRRGRPAVPARPGGERDPPRLRLIGYRRITLSPGESRRLTFRFHADLSSFTDRTGARVVEPGALELRPAASSTGVRHTVRLRLTGPVRVVGADRRLRCEVEVSRGTD